MQHLKDVDTGGDVGAQLSVMAWTDKAHKIGRHVIAVGGLFTCVKAHALVCACLYVELYV